MKPNAMIFREDSKETRRESNLHDRIDEKLLDMGWTKGFGLDYSSRTQSGAQLSVYDIPNHEGALGIVHSNVPSNHFVREVSMHVLANSKQVADEIAMTVKGDLDKTISDYMGNPPSQ